MHIVIIGAGIAGLGAAYRAMRAAQSGLDIEVTVVEKEDRVGGQLWTDSGTDENGATIIADGGSDSYLTQKPSIKRVAGQLGCPDAIQSTNDANKKTYIIKDGRLVEMPDGIMMFAPTKILPLATSSLYSWPAKFRMLGDVFIPKKKQPEGGFEDESLESLVVRRLGRECLDNLAEAIVGGVNGSDPKTMSIAATYPNLLEMEQEHGSLIMGFLAQRRKVEAMKKTHPLKPGQKPSTFFSSFKGGLGTLTDRLAQAVVEAGGTIIRGDGARQIERREDGSFTVTLESGQVLQGDAIISAAPAWESASLLRTIVPAASEVLDTIPHSSCATVVLGFDKADAPFDKHWHGILSPAKEHRSVTGINLVSSKWEGRCPDDKVLIRGFVGGPRDPEVVEKSDEEIIALARNAYEELLGLKPGAALCYSKVFRFPRRMPQYTVGHLSRMAQLDEIIADSRGLALAGAAYKGVGVPNCLESGEAACDKVLADAGIKFEDLAVAGDVRSAQGRGRS